MSDTDAIKAQLAELRQAADAEAAAREGRIKQRAVAAIREHRQAAAALAEARAARKARG